MASSYPSSADALSNPASGDALSTGHAAQHANANDAIEAIESTLGLNPQGASATVKARLDAIEADSWVTSARILDGTIVNGDVSASAAIDPSKVAQNVVTFSNADAVVATSTRKLVQIGTMSASRTVTLPAASGVPAGTELVVADLSGSVTTTNTIVVARAGSDTVNGATSTTIGAAYGWRRFVSDGSSKWVFDGGVLRTSDTGTVTSSNILDGTIVNADISASAAIDITKLSTGVVTSASVGNLLAAAQATGSEAPTAGSNTNCTVTVDNTQYYQGTDSVLLTSAASGAMASKAYTVAIPAAGTYTVFCRVRTDQTVMGLIMASSGTGISYDTAKVAANSTGWTNYVSIVTATQATTLTISPTTTGTYGHPTGAGQKLWLDTLGVWQGTGGLWALPGTPIANLGTYTDESVGRRIFTWDTVNSRWQMTFGSTGVRVISVWDAAGTVTGTALPTGWGPVSGQPGYYRLQRFGNVCTASIAMLQATSTSPTTLTVPAGFAPLTGSQFLVPMVPGSGAQVARTWQNSGGLGRGASTLFTANDYVYAAEFSWYTADSWPSSLPGSAVGSIPQ